MSYIPNKPTPRPWTSEAQFPGGHQHSRMGPVHTGSSRNLQRGYLGAPETNVGSALTSLLRTNANRFMYYKAAMEHVDRDFGALHDDLSHSGPPSLGAPHADVPVGPQKRIGPDGEQVAIGRGAFVMGPAPRQTRPVGPSAEPVVNQQLALNAGPRVHVISAQGPQKPLGERFGHLVSGPGLASPSTLGTSSPPSARQPGRRAPSGMDPRKRGTWLNYK